MDSKKLLQPSLCRALLLQMALAQSLLQSRALSSALASISSGSANAKHEVRWVRAPLMHSTGSLSFTDFPQDLKHLMSNFIIDHHK